jgi:hypothetical protein
MCNQTQSESSRSRCGARSRCSEAVVGEAVRVCDAQCDWPHRPSRRAPARHTLVWHRLTLQRTRPRPTAGLGGIGVLDLDDDVRGMQTGLSARNKHGNEGEKEHERNASDDAANDNRDNVDSGSLGPAPGELYFVEPLLLPTCCPDGDRAWPVMAREGPGQRCRTRWWRA